MFNRLFEQEGGGYRFVGGELVSIADPSEIQAIEEAVATGSRPGFGAKSNNLGPALDALIGKGMMHPALREAFLKLYGYTSDEKGIRHAMDDEPAQIGFDEAKFMLVACRS